MSMDEKINAKHTFCIVIGGGMCGIALAAHLVKWSVVNYDEFVIMDLQDDYGGCWHANKYPGLACDVVSHCYSMRFHLKPDWSSKYATRAEIQGYYADMADYYRLRQSTLFNTKVKSAKWSDDSLLWTVVCEKTTGEVSTWTANVIVNASGQFTRPKFADIPGREVFQGTQWHTSRWNASYDLKGKNVAIVGTGPSTAQIAPCIQPFVKNLYLYQRSPTYVMPRRNEPIPSNWQQWFKTCPPLLWFYHMYLYIKKERSRPAWYRGTKEQAFLQSVAIGHLERTIKDKALLEKLRPHHEFGCKRPLVLDDYYPMLEKANVELITDKPVRITNDSIISKPTRMLSKTEMGDEPVGSYDIDNATDDAKEVEKNVDVLIWGTGFDMRHKGANFEVYGQNGVNLDELWGEEPAAYYGVTVNKFPNMLWMFGPNSAAPWANLTTVFEAQAKYNAQVIKRIKQKSQSHPYALMVKASAQDNYNQWIQDNMGAIAIVSPNCSNYYINSKGHITFNWPFTGYYYQWCLLWPVFRDFEIVQ